MGASAPIKMMGRYALFREIAAGGMAVVHLGRLQGPVGFSRTVAIKRLYPQYARDPEFVSMFLDEARLAARVRHPNVVPTLDVVASSGELFLVMEYVHGDSLARLLRAASERRERIPPRIILSIAVGALAGLHAAHEARGARGEALGIVHRDISPQNILVGSDGSPRIVDFGVAKAAGRVQTTRDGQLKGKIGYFAPEQISGTVTRKTDIFALSIVLWEALTGRRLFRGENDATTLYNLLHAPIAPPSTFAPEVPPGVDAAVLKGLERDPARRFDTARDMALELERNMPLASPNDVGSWVERLAHDTLAKRAGFVAEVEGSGPELPDDSVEQIMSPSMPPIGHEDETRSDVSQRSALAIEQGSGVSGRRESPGRSDASGRILPIAELASPPSRGSAVDTLDLDRPSRPPPAESTSLSVATSMSQLGVRPMPWRWVAGGAALLVILFAVVTLTNSGSRNVISPATTASAVPDPGPVVPPAEPTASAPTNATATPPPVAPAPTVEKSAAPQVPKAPAPTRPPPIKKQDPRPPPPPRVTPSNTHCVPPYTLDASGRKKWKPECL